MLVSGGSSYTAAITASEALSSIELAVNTATGGAVTATDDGAGHLLLKSGTNFTVNNSTTSNSLGLTTGSSVAAVTASPSAATSLAAGTLQIQVGSTTYSVSVSASSSLASIESAINGTSGLGSAGAVTATDDGAGHLVLTSNSSPNGFTVVDGTLAEGLGVTTAGNNASPDGSSSARTTLQTNYNTLLTQINQLAGDSGYNGVNLIGGNNLQINFNETATSSLTIARRELQCLGPRPVLDQRLDDRLFLR